MVSDFKSVVLCKFFDKFLVRMIHRFKMNFWTTVLHSSYLRCSCLINRLTKGKEYYRVPFSFMFRSKKKYQYFCPFLGGRAGGLGGASMNYVLRRLSLLPLMRPWKQFLLSLGSVDFWWDKRSLMNYSERELPLLVSLSRGNTITSWNTTSKLYQLWSYIHIPANKTIQYDTIWISKGKKMPHVDVICLCQSLICFYLCISGIIQNPFYHC